MHSLPSAKRSRPYTSLSTHCVHYTPPLLPSPLRAIKGPVSGVSCITKHPSNLLKLPFVPRASLMHHFLPPPPSFPVSRKVIPHLLSPLSLPTLSARLPHLPNHFPQHPHPYPHRNLTGDIVHHPAVHGTCGHPSSVHPSFHRHHSRNPLHSQVLQLRPIWLEHHPTATAFNLCSSSAPPPLPSPSQTSSARSKPPNGFILPQGTSPHHSLSPPMKSPPNPSPSTQVRRSAHWL